MTLTLFITEKRPLPQAFTEHPEEFNIVDRIIYENSEQGRPSRKQLKLARILNLNLIRQEKIFKSDIAKVLTQFGIELGVAAEDVLNSKNSAQDAMDAALIAKGVIGEAAINKAVTDLNIVYETNYRRILKTTNEAIGSTLNLGISIVDDTEAVILSQGGKRVGLLNIPGKTQSRVFQQLSEGRFRGEDVASLARRIKDIVPAGRFTGGLGKIKNPTQKQIEAAGKRARRLRAQLIARTEAGNAQTMSAVATYKANDVTRVLILDSRKGSFDADCDAWNSQIVSLEQGQALIAQEHPNGTRMMVAQPPEI